MGRFGRPALPWELRRQFWVALREGRTLEDAARVIGVPPTSCKRWFHQAGGVAPKSLKEPSGRYLSLADRDVIAVRHAAGKSNRQIAKELGRAPSTIGRELERNRQPQWPYEYLPANAQSKADRQARRPKLSKIARCPRLAGYVQDKMSGEEHWSPEQISHRLEADFPDDESMRISHESIYRSLYVQGRGELRRELTRCLRTGRAVRRPQRRADERRGRIANMVNISERPAEVEDRAVPGHWEGDLILGKNNHSAIGTLVERTTRFVMLLHLPHDREARTVAAAIAAATATLPDALRRSLTWDQGRELSTHVQLAIDADLDIYFCDPHSPWQRGTNENTNGLLRQYFPKSTDLAVHPAQRLIEVADALNGRPRKTLDWRTPAEALAKLLSDPQTHGVATTT